MFEKMCFALSQISTIESKDEIKCDQTKWNGEETSSVSFLFSIPSINVIPMSPSDRLFDVQWRREMSLSIDQRNRSFVVCLREHSSIDLNRENILRWSDDAIDCLQADADGILPVKSLLLLHLWSPLLDLHSVNKSRDFGTGQWGCYSSLQSGGARVIVETRRYLPFGASFNRLRTFTSTLVFFVPSSSNSLLCREICFLATFNGK